MAAADRTRISGIELLRFGAALTVLVAHYNHFFVYGYASELPSIERQPLFALLSPLYRYGTRAVEVFWCLSGFIFFYKYAEPIRARAMPALRFFWLRFSRLYPLHFATLILVAVLQHLYRSRNGSFFLVELNDLKHFVLNLFFASNWGLQDGFSFNAPVWSVSLEVLAYAFFYCVTYALGAGAFVVVGCLLGCVALTHAMGTEAVATRCIFYFYMGGLSFLGYQALSRRLQGSRVYLALGPLIAVEAIALAMFAATGNLDWMLNLGIPVALAVLAIGSSLLPSRAARACDTLGNLTYASYLIHFPVQLAVMLVVTQLGINHGFAYSPVFFTVYIAGVICLSQLVFSHLELPAQAALRARTLGGAGRVETSPGTP
jgi:peptidoglycan/LPS O-acetylase OafA/YrhL